MAIKAKIRKPPLSRNWRTISKFCFQRFRTMSSPIIVPNLGRIASEMAGPKFKNCGDMAMGAKLRKPPISPNWWTLFHIFWHFWKALGQGYMTPKFCGPKFKNGGDITWGAKHGKPPISRKLLRWPPLEMSAIVKGGHHAAGQSYTTPNFCGPKFKNGGVMAMGV